MSFVTTKDGTEIFYRDQGSGTPVVLIHGWPLNGDSWDVQTNFLAEHGLRDSTMSFCSSSGAGVSEPVSTPA